MLRVWRCQKAGCAAATYNVWDALRDGWNIPDREPRDRHDVAALTLCPRCWHGARSAVQL